jgi:redox-sensitive bicupin YhaK (pirin superfamily)
VSTVESDLDVAGAAAQRAPGDTEVTTARLARVGDLDVRRLLPLRRRRCVGPWCFVDHYGPASVDGVAGMQVPPHPHIGLQTVTWLIEGTVLHRDSLGSEQLIRPGQLKLMTRGHGIAHSEESPEDHDPWLARGAALAGAARRGPAGATDFEHHAELPALRLGGLTATVFAGSLAGVNLPRRVFSSLVGAELRAPVDARGHRTRWRAS